MPHYGPTDRWMEHPKPHFQRVLKEARSRGWSLEYHTSHQTYTITCPSRECQELIYKSGRNGETFSREILETVRDCMHGSGHQDMLVAAVERMDQAQILLDGADRLIERNRTQEATLIAIAEEASDAEDLLARFLSLADEAAELLGEGLDTPEGAVDDADEHLSAARGYLYELHKAVAVKKARSRLKRLRSRATQLRQLMASS